MEAILLVGGMGTRVSTITQNKFPKALLEIQEKPIVQWEIEWLARYGVRKVILAAGNLGNELQKVLGSEMKIQVGEEQASVQILYSHEKTKLGSGGAVKLATRFVEGSDVIVMNGDILTNYDLERQMQFHEKHGTGATVNVVKMRSPYGVVVTGRDGKVSEFMEKPILDVWIHAGVDMFSMDWLKQFPNKGQMEDTAFLTIADQGKMMAYHVDASFYWQSIDSVKDFKTANEDWVGL